MQKGMDSTRNGPSNPSIIEGDTWSILAVDDDPLYQRTTQLALKNFQTLGKPVKVIQAFSYSEACLEMARHPDIAVVLLDVVMDTDDAGFRVVRAIREVMGNAEVRIVMLTGQPGFSSMQESLADYDINDYWNKTELSAQRLRALVTTSVRAYQHLRIVNRARKGLQSIAESSGSLSEARTLEDYSSRMITAISELLESTPDGIVCVGLENGSDPRILASAGSLASSTGKPLEELSEPAIRRILLETLQNKRSRFDKEFTTLFFSRELAGAEYAAYVATQKRLTDTEIQLLMVFVQTLGRGLHNVALFSQLDRMAYQDSLVDLPNGNSLIRAVEAAMGRPGQVLLLLNLDGFSDLNLALGSQTGDEILKAVARCLEHSVPPLVMKARIHDDIFALLGPESMLDVSHVERAIEESSRSLGFGTLSVSSVYCDMAQPAENAMQLITQARLSLKRGKEKGISQHVQYDPEISIRAQSRYSMLSEFKDALERNEIGIALQPQIDLASGKVVGAEALARWTGADGTPISPAEFIPLAETTGLILRMGEQVLQKTLQALQKIRSAGYPQIRLGFNASTVQLMNPDFVQQLAVLIQEASIPPEYLELEITESAAMESFERVIAVLASVRRLGLQIAIDDFGTGFSSLAYLKRLPADRLKIDRTFVNEVGLQYSSLPIAENIIELAGKLGLSTIAEGVETSAQVDWLKRNNCTEVQGYFFARPMPVDEFLGWIKSYT